MAQKSSKHKNTGSVQLSFGAGVNLADAPASLPPGQMADVLNLFYDNARAVLSTRPGLVHVLGPRSGEPAIVALCACSTRNMPGPSLAAAFSDGVVAVLSQGEWLTLGQLSAPGIVPAMAAFNGSLIVADPGAPLQAWDGAVTQPTSLQPLSGSPQASALALISGRLAANSATDLDAVVLCGPYDETDWDVAQGNALLLRAGYGDGLGVTAFGVLGQDLMVFKSGGGERRILRLNTAGAPVSWSVTQLSRSVGASSAQAVESVGNTLLFGSDRGIMDLAGVQQYGDLQVGGAGRPVNPLLGARRVSSIRLLPALGAAFCLVEGESRIPVYHPHNQAWSVLDFQGMFVTAVCQMDDQVYLAAGGRLYRLGEGETTDELTPGQHLPVTASLRTGLFCAPGGCGGIILRGLTLDLEALSPGQGVVQALLDDQVSPVTLAAWDANPGQGKLNQALAPLHDAQEPLGVPASFRVGARARVRAQTLSFQIATSQGRVRLGLCRADIAAVNA